MEAVSRAVETTFVTEHAQTRRFEAMVCDRTGAAHAVAYSNATCALFAALKALGIGSGDEVIVPDLTFVATANAVILAGATPVFCDVDPQWGTIDPQQMECLVTPRTRAVIPVHLYGLSADMDALMAQARRLGLLVIEDAAQAIGVTWRGRHVATIGDVGVLSFYGNKTITTGEGGVIVTDDAELARECYRLKNHGRDEKGVFVHERIGFNFSFTEMQAALGVVQLGKLDRVIARKEAIRRFYQHRLLQIDWLKFQEVPEACNPVHWFTNIFCDDVSGLAKALESDGIETRRLFYPLHLQPCYRHLDPAPAPCPVSRRLYETGLSLPSSCGIDESALDRVCESVAGYGAVV